MDLAAKSFLNQCPQKIALGHELSVNFLPVLLFKCFKARFELMILKTINFLYNFSINDSNYHHLYQHHRQNFYTENIELAIDTWESNATYIHPFISRTEDENESESMRCLPKNDSFTKWYIILCLFLCSICALLRTKSSACSIDVLTNFILCLCFNAQI